MKPHTTDNGRYGRYPGWIAFSVLAGLVTGQVLDYGMGSQVDGDSIAVSDEVLEPVDEPAMVNWPVVKGEELMDFEACILSEMPALVSIIEVSRDVMEEVTAQVSSLRETTESLAASMSHCGFERGYSGRIFELAVALANAYYVDEPRRRQFWTDLLSTVELVRSPPNRWVQWREFLAWARGPPW